MQLSHSIQMMGTTIDILIDSDTPKEHIAEVCHLLELYKNRFSANDADSELMVINDNSSIAPVTVHQDLFNLIAIGKKHSLATPSNLNIAIGPLVQSWRIGFDDANVPSPQKIQKALALSKPENIILDATKQSVFLSQKGMKIDLGALAKGYIADKIMDYLKSEKVTSAMINLGGNVLVYGDNPRNDNGIWRIGIQNPQKSRGNHIGILTLKNQSAVTSGIYERRLKVGNKEYHHIFDQEEMRLNNICHFDLLHGKSSPSPYLLRTVLLRLQFCHHPSFLYQTKFHKNVFAPPNELNLVISLSTFEDYQFHWALVY